ncbi:MAG: GNAT family N-acetyltransferase [Nocardioidaceae bacterium]
MSLRRSDVGSRVVVRSTVPGETGATGGPALTDVIGVLREYAPGHLVVERRDGSVVDLPTSLVVAAKTLGPAPRLGLRIEADALQQVITTGWPGAEQQRLGDWVLRSSAGFTSRANSTAAHGEPGVPADEALARVAEFYLRRDQRPSAQVVVGSRWEEVFAEAGWRPVTDRDPALVQVASLRRALAATGPLAAAGTVAGPPSAGVVVSSRCDDAWLSAYGRARGADPAVVRAVLEGSPVVALARLDDPPVAIGRAVVDGKWAGLSAVEVAAGHRRRGLGQAMVDTMLRWAEQHGARWCYLQVTADNAAALSLYEGYGFVTHHRYRYLLGPES